MVYLTPKIDTTPRNTRFQPSGQKPTCPAASDDGVPS